MKIYKLDEDDCVLAMIRKFKEAKQSMDLAYEVYEDMNNKQHSDISGVISIDDIVKLTDALTAINETREDLTRLAYFILIDLCERVFID